GDSSSAQIRGSSRTSVRRAAVTAGRSASAKLASGVCEDSMSSPGCANTESILYTRNQRLSPNPQCHLGQEVRQCDAIYGVRPQLVHTATLDGLRSIDALRQFVRKGTVAIQYHLADFAHFPRHLLIRLDQPPFQRTSRIAGFAGYPVGGFRALITF